MKVGVVLMLEGSAHLGVPRYREVRDLALQAEHAGFDSIWIYDHLLFRSDDGTIGQWECFAFLAALAEATERIEIGTLVACTAFRNPALTAKIATALDEISGGRFTLGLGAGWNKPEFNAFGLPFDHRVDRFEEALKIIVPLVRTGSVDFEGTYYQAPNCEDLPRGPRPGGSPIMIGASGPRMLRLAAQYADSINTGFDIEKYERGQTPVDEACRAVGRDPATLALTFPAWVAFPDVGYTPPHMKDSQYHKPEEVAAYLRKNEQAGVAHMMIDFRPNNAAALSRLSEALKLYRPANESPLT